LAAKVFERYTLLYIVYRGFLWCFSLHFGTLRGRGTPRRGAFGEGKGVCGVLGGRGGTLVEALE